MKARQQSLHDTASENTPTRNYLTEHARVEEGEGLVSRLHCTLTDSFVLDVARIYR